MRRCLSAVGICLALGPATMEQSKHLAAADAGLLAGLRALPGLRTLRPRLAAIADATDPLALQRMFAAAMLAAARWSPASATSMTTSSPAPAPSRRRVNFFELLDLAAPIVGVPGRRRRAR